MATTPPVVNNAEEASAIRQLLQGQTRVLLVTSAFHMRRSQFLFECHGLQVLPFPVDFQAYGRWSGPLWRASPRWIPSACSLANSFRVVRQLLARLVYRTW